MKKLLLFLPIIVFMFGSAAQEKENRFKKDFEKVDSIFNTLEIEYNSIMHDMNSYSVNALVNQDITKAPSIKWDSSQCTIIAYPHDNCICVGKNRNAQINDAIIDLLLEYKQECYNDSTLTLEYYKEFSEAAKERIKGKVAFFIKESDYVLVPHHQYKRKTPTFEDFLNWIEERK
jgi:hypothetical protein